MKNLNCIIAFTALILFIIFVIYKQVTTKDEIVTGERVENEDRVIIPWGSERKAVEKELSKIEIVGLDREEFFEIFRGLDPGGRSYRMRVLRVWEIIQRSEFSPLEGEEVVQNGLVLPSAVSSLLSGEEFSVNDIEVLKSESEKEMGEKIFWLFSMDSLSGGRMIPQLINARSDGLPPTSLDLAVLYSTMKAFRKINPVNNKTELASWSSMSSSSNPIYRLIALKASVVATPEEVQNISSEDRRYNLKAAKSKNIFYQDYLEETDPFIVLELIRTISIHPCGEAKINFEKLEANPFVKGSELLRQEIEIAKVNLDNYLE